VYSQTQPAHAVVTTYRVHNCKEQALPCYDHDGAVVSFASILIGWVGVLTISMEKLEIPVAKMGLPHSVDRVFRNFPNGMAHTICFSNWNFQFFCVYGKHPGNGNLPTQLSHILQWEALGGLNILQVKQNLSFTTCPLTVTSFVLGGGR
jgi:hypothetical protein